MGLSRQVTYHLIHTMLGTGIIRKNESNRYVLGLAAVAIAEGFHRQLAPPEQLARKVRSIVAAIAETAHAGGWVNGEIVALATAAGSAPVGAAKVPQGYSGYAHARNGAAADWRPRVLPPKANGKPDDARRGLHLHYLYARSQPLMPVPFLWGAGYAMTPATFAGSAAGRTSRASMASASRRCACAPGSWTCHCGIATRRRT